MSLYDSGSDANSALKNHDKFKHTIILYSMYYPLLLVWEGINTYVVSRILNWGVQVGSLSLKPYDSIGSRLLLQLFKIYIENLNRISIYIGVAWVCAWYIGIRSPCCRGV